MEKIKNTNTLKSLSKKFDFDFDKEYKYITKYNNKITTFYSKEKEYKIQYFDGCLYPYLVVTNRKKCKSLAELYFLNIKYYDVKDFKNGDFVVIFDDNKLTKEVIEKLDSIFYNINFNYKITSQYAPEYNKKCIVVKNKMEV